MRSPLAHTRTTPLRAGVSILVAIALIGGLAVTSPSLAQDATTYDFNTPNQLADLFNGTRDVASVSQQTTGGIGGSGAIHVPNSSVNAVFTSKEGYSLGPIGSVYRFSTYIKSEGNSGYSGVGFASASPTTASSLTAYRPDNALGISVHGGGYIFHNGTTDYHGSWSSNAGGGLTTITASTCSDLINNRTACGSPDQWFQIVFIVKRVTATTFDLRVEVWPSDVDGTLRFTDASAIVELNGITNTTILDAPLLHSYFSFSGVRVTRFDNYTVALSGGATAFSADAPVVLTKNVEVVGNPTIALAGQVTADRGTAVVQRGFVYSTDPNPTVSDTKVVFGSGVGEFTGTTALPASGTYYFRSFATNATTTGYGAQVAVNYVSSGNPPQPPPPPGTNTQTGGTDDPATTLAVGAAQTLRGPQSVLVRRGEIVPTRTSVSGGIGPRGGVVIEDPTSDLRVTVAAAGGVGATTGINVATDGEIVCEICAQLAAGSVVEAWIYSTPRLAGAIRIDADIADGECPLLRIPVGAPLDGGGAIAPGAHTLQLRMLTTTGLEVLAIPITVGDTVGGAGSPVPASVPTGGGPRPLPHVLMSGLLVAMLLAVLVLGFGGALTDTYRVLAGARDTIIAAAGPIAGRRLDGFDALERRLDELRRSIGTRG